MSLFSFIFSFFYFIISLLFLSIFSTLSLNLRSFLTLFLCVSSVKWFLCIILAYFMLKNLFWDELGRIENPTYDWDFGKERYGLSWGSYILKTSWDFLSDNCWDWLSVPLIICWSTVRWIRAFLRWLLFWGESLCKSVFFYPFFIKWDNSWLMCMLLSSLNRAECCLEEFFLKYSNNLQ